MAKPLELTIDYTDASMATLSETVTMFVNVMRDNGYFDWQSITAKPWITKSGFKTAVVVKIHCSFVMWGLPEEVDTKLKQRIVHQLTEAGHIVRNESGSMFFE